MAKKKTGRPCPSAALDFPPAIAKPGLSTCSIPGGAATYRRGFFRSTRAWLAKEETRVASSGKLAFMTVRQNETLLRRLMEGV